MDSGANKVKPANNPRKDANIFSILFFYWVTPLLDKGYRKELEQHDLYEALDQDHSEVLGSQLEREWMKELEGEKKTSNKLESNTKSEHSIPKLRNAFIRTFTSSLILPGIICFVEECAIRLLQPWFMGQFMSYFIHGTDTTETTFLMASFYAGGVVFMSACYNVTHHLYFFTVQMIGMRIRIAAGSLIYRKALRLSNESVSKYTTGKIVNLLSNDVNRFDISALFLHYLWVAPLQFGIVLYLTWQQLGEVTLAGAAIILIFVPMLGWLSKQFYTLRGQTAKRTDERIGLMNELINGIKVIKMYAWEQSFSDLIEQVREKEIRVIQKGFWFKAINYATFLLFLRIALALILVVWVLQQNIVTPEIAFLTLSWYNVTKLSLVNFFPAALTNVAETLKTIDRVEEFLLLGEFRETRVLKNKNANVFDETVTSKDDRLILNDPYFVSARNISAKWDFETIADTIKDVGFQIKRGECIGICGSVGEGKSSLLQCFLGELPSYAGDIEIRGKLGYASQDPWIFDGTIRQNILFGKEYEPKRYNETIKLCRMTHDIASFEHGSNEIVGDRGTTLSGGQKARLNLARCIYRDSDIYLLDDPLSAVDANVGKELFEKCIRGHLRRKVVVLVTHQLHFLSNVDKIIVLNQGQIVESGTYNQLMSINGGRLSMLLKETPETVIENDAEVTTKDTLALTRRSSLSVRRQSLRRVSISEENIEMYEEDVEDDSVTSDVGLKEVSKVGSVNIKLYWKYVRAGASTLGVVILVLSTFIGHGLFRFTDAWLGIWTSKEVLAQMTNLSSHFEARKADDITSTAASLNSQKFSNINYFYLLVYCSSVIGMTFSILLMINRFFVMCTNASKKLHNQMFGRILCAPSKFFNDNPKGRILNRFSKDIGCMDDILPQVNTDVYQIMMRIVGIIAVVTYKIWWMILPTIVLVLVFYFARRYYLKSSVAIKRIEGASKSPIISQLASSLNGLSTIRCCEATVELIKEFDDLQDLHSSAWYCFMSTSRFLAVVCDWIVFVYLCLCTFPFLILGQENVEVSDVGLVISTALALTGMLQYGMRQSAEMENLMTSVERVLEYSEIKTEEESEGEHMPTKNDSSSSIDGAPTNGVIEFKNVFLQYTHDGRYVLQNVNFKTGKEEKVGVVGRTGAGKSSLVAALFRLVESEGDIFIDGHSIKEKMLNSLRKSISIIPQDPVLFTGTLRMNLDPFSSYTDDQIWDSLRLSNLYGFVSLLPKGLQHSFTEGGDNLSVGQRQLMCLARALLRKTKILVLDEATANVDLETDEFIQHVIRKEFSDCTVLTIAHRLNTIIDYDKILVLQEGKVIEFDTPDSLVRKEHTLFHSMLKDAGIVISSRL